MASWALVGGSGSGSRAIEEGGGAIYQKGVGKA